MAKKLSKDNQRKISASLEREEEQKIAQRKAMDEVELRGLSRQARMMKEPKFRDAVTKRQKKVKNILIEENDDLTDTLYLMKSRKQCISDTKKAQDISNLFAQGDDLDEAIAQEKKYIQDLESQINKKTKHIYILRKKKGNSVNNSEYLQSKENERANRTLESLKSRLDGEQTQLSTITKENEVMRNKMQNLLKEKGQFNEIFETLVGKLKRGKEIMVDVVERSRQQFQNRDEIARKIEILRSRDKADLAKRMEEMQELEIKLFEDEKLAIFRFKVQSIRANLQGVMRNSDKDSVEQEKLMKRLEKANELWEKLKETTGLSTSDEISKHIMDEDSNLFSIFNFNNEIRAHLEVLTNKIVELVSSVNEEINAAEEHHQGTIEERNLLVGRLENMEQKLNDLSDYNGANSRLLNRLLDKVMILFNLMGCTSSTLQDLLGNDSGINVNNCRLYLELIETEVIKALEVVTRPTLSTAPSVRSRMYVGAGSMKSLHRNKTNLMNGVISKKLITMPCFDCDGFKLY